CRCVPSIQPSRSTTGTTSGTRISRTVHSSLRPRWPRCARSSSTACAVREEAGMSEDVGVLRAIWIKRVRLGPMDRVGEATLVENRGILRNANQNGRRQVTLIEEEVWQQLMSQLGADLDPSARRANLMISAVRLADSRDRLLRIGECVIDIRGETRPCERMDEALPGLRRISFAVYQAAPEGELSEEQRGGAAARLRRPPVAVTGRCI